MDEGLKHLFDSYGEVLYAKVVKDQDTGKSRGFGFVTMKKESEASLAIRRLHGKFIEGMTLSVRKSKDQHSQTKPISPK